MGSLQERDSGQKRACTDAAIISSITGG